jgi:signal transduction histidine kinase
MLNTLRNRLVLSHVLPLLVIIPILGVALVYMLETRELLPSLSKALLGDARLVAEVTRSQTKIWDNSAYAERLLDRVSPDLEARVMLIDPDGRLLASSDPKDDNRLNQTLSFQGLAAAQKGQKVSLSNYSQRLRGDIVDVLVPVHSVDGKEVGIVRTSYPYSSVSEEFVRLRYLIVAILLLSLLPAFLAGYLLAVTIGAPVQRVTQAVTEVANGKRSEKLPEQGPQEIRQLLRSVNILAERLESLEGSRKQLLANLVHELGRPLGALRAAIQTLQRGAKENPLLLDEFLTGMDGEAARLQRLLDDLRQLHDQVLGSMELRYQRISLSHWLPEILLPWQQAAKEKHLQWKTDIPANLPPVEADPLRLAQIIGNLVSNAIKFTPAQGAICISVGIEAEQACFQIKDSGVGIPGEEQSKIFTPFYRGSSSSRFPQGMGLGLRIAQDLVQAHGGRITVESNPGSGSTFAFQIPLKSVKNG